MENPVPWEPIFEHEDDWIMHRYNLATGNVLRFAARDIRKDQFGVHANVSITLNWVTLAWSKFNVEKDEERVRLTNSAYGHMDDKSLDAAEFPKTHLKHALDLFTMGLWDETVSVNIGGMLEGNPDISPARRLVGDYILADAGTIMFAPPGEGKSYTSMCMASSLMWGIEKVWKLGERLTPLYINVERSKESMQARLARVNMALGLDARTPLPFLNARGRSLSDIYEAARRTIKKEGCKVVFYDSISRAGFGSLIADDVANKVMDMLNALSPTWVALAHSPRGDESHTYGSQMFDAAADLTIQLKSQTSTDQRTTGVGLEGHKANDIPVPKMAVHVFEWDDDGLVDVRCANKGEFAELEAGRRLSLEDAISNLLKTHGAMSGTAIADTLGRNRSYIATLLSTSARFVAVRKEGSTQLYGLKASVV